MSKTRILKRVPMDFTWPLHKVWEGYLTSPQFEPTSGDGYQLWETTTEGSPISPVFGSLGELCAWSEANAAVFAGTKLSAEDWEKYLTNPDAQISIGNIILG